MSINGNIECEICNEVDFDVEEIGFEWEFAGQCDWHSLWLCKTCNDWDNIVTFMEEQYA